MPGNVLVDVVVWTVLIAGPVLAVWSAVQVSLARRRAPAVYRFCAVCDHDLQGLDGDATCPECGGVSRWRYCASWTNRRLLATGLLAGAFCTLATVGLVAWAFAPVEAAGVLIAVPCSMVPVFLGVFLGISLRHLPRRFIVAAIGCAFGGALLAGAWAIYEGGVRSSDPLGGLVVLALPIVQSVGAAYGFWLAFLLFNPRKQLSALAAA